MRIVGYTYSADNYCRNCILDAYGSTRIDMDAELALDLLAEQKCIDRQDESTFDSDDFPKIIFSLGDPQVCGTCHVTFR